MTKWDEGQNLIVIADCIFDIEDVIRKSGNAELAEKLRNIRLSVGDLFLENNDHVFSIPSTKDK
jgi:hypothetical protein